MIEKNFQITEGIGAEFGTIWQNALNRYWWIGLDRHLYRERSVWFVQRCVSPAEHHVLLASGLLTRLGADAGCAALLLPATTAKIAGR